MCSENNERYLRTQNPKCHLPLVSFLVHKNANVSTFTEGRNEKSRNMPFPIVAASSR